MRKSFRILPVISCLLPITSCLFPITARAEAPLLGVVKSEDNALQWDGITRRLSATGIAYCVVDLQQVNNTANLANSQTRVLFLPNVTTINATQLKVLQEWMGKGSIVATGPVGTSSVPSVRAELRSLLGAYWGFANTTTSTIQPLKDRTQETWIKQNGLAGNVNGGVVIPAGLKSQTAAIWKLKENTPAVVTTDKSVFLGWRWGVDAVAPKELDSAWLRAALSRYGIVPNNQNSNAAPKSCLPTQTNISSVSLPVAAKTAPTASAWQEVPAAINSPNPKVLSSLGVPSSISRFGSAALPATPALNGSLLANQTPKNPENERKIATSSSVPDSTPIKVQIPSVSPSQEPAQPLQIEDIPLTPPAEVKPKLRGMDSTQADAMRYELSTLIGRFESALLASKVTSESPKLSGQSESKSKLNSERANQRANVQAVSYNSRSPKSSEISSSPTRALSEAKMGLQKFLRLIEQNDYTGALENWVQARRTLWDNYPTDRQIQQPEIRAVWLDRGTIVKARSPEDLAKIFDYLATAGINTVFFEAVNAGYTLFPSRVAPEQNPATRGWDRLEAAVKLAHERGIELHAWAWIFAAGNRNHNKLINQPANYPGPLISAHPTWANYDNQGRLIDPRSGKIFIDPANPEVRRYLWDLLDEIATRYQVDGIHLDYIRYPFQDPKANQTYGYGTAANQIFYELTGSYPQKISPTQPDLWQKWTDFRISQIDSFVATASQRLRAKRPELIMSAAVFPYPKQERLQKLQQNWEDWAKKGDIDLIVPMTYVQETSKLQQLTQPFLTQADLGASLILPGIRLLNLPEVAAVDQIQLLRDLPVGGYSLFAVQDFNNRLYTMFNRSQGPVQISNVALPYRQPFRAAANRYAALQKEWNFLLINKQIRMDETAYKDWQKQSDELAKALNQLATKPSNRQILLAKSNLISFRSQFQKWMQQQAVEQPYQVQVWNNRLGTVERLLRYGERVELNRQNRSVAQQK